MTAPSPATAAALSFPAGWLPIADKFADDAGRAAFTSCKSKILRA
jgi:hypothetical protein